MPTRRRDCGHGRQLSSDSGRVHLMLEREGSGWSLVNGVDSNSMDEDEETTPFPLREFLLVSAREKGSCPPRWPASSDIGNG